MILGTREALDAILTLGSLGAGEAYMSGDVDLEGDIHEFFRVANHPSVRSPRLRSRDKAKIVAAYVRNRNTLRKARENIEHHYDLGNDFYRLWLDESMAYSCAYWDDGCDGDLEAAQRAKYEHICRKLNLRAGERLIDFGSGWGGMLAYAARERGIEGMGCTLSTQQNEFANKRFRAEGLYPRVHSEVVDYRQCEGEFDKFVSVGMFEHVGREYYSEFFEKVRGVLVKGGVGVLHTIGREREAGLDPWISKYIFPGAYLPTLAQLSESMAEAGLIMTDMENLRLHYARTLDAWAQRFEARADEVRDRFGERFVRMWRFYLYGCSAGFKWGDLRVFQITFTNGLNSDLPLTRSHVYAR
jgi:cyclopropane-fatty-acyl-phospholipid synthase